MKKFLFAIAALLITSVSIAQSLRSVPSVSLKNLDGTTIDTGTLENDGKPIVICFWATWCSPCRRELDNYAELYEDWQDETGIKIIAVTIDDQRSKNQVAPTVNASEWEYEILLDPNKEFSRAMQVVNVPHTFLIDGNGNIVWQHNNYADGDEDELYDEIKKLMK